MPLKPPSIINSTTVPVFALKWFSSPNLMPSHVLVFAGGGGSARTGIGNSVQVKIDTKTPITIDTGVEIGAALDVLVSNEKNIYVAIGVGDSVKIYLIRPEGGVESQVSDDTGGSATQVALLDFEKGSGVNALNFSVTGAAIVVGCENGKVYVCSMQHNDSHDIGMNIDFELEGHIKAVCACSFHPTNPGVLISSAKDGACRVWNLAREGPDKCMETLACKIYDPKGPTPKPNILNPKPGQLLVRGCAFGDLEGRIVYTIQSGRKGGAFLSVWKLLRRLIPGEMEISPKDPAGPPQPKVVFEFKETLRKKVSEYPVSAMSLSGDYSTLALGDTNGSITLLSTANDKFKRIKFWECVHDLPVTVIAARPVPVPLPLTGEDLTGISVDAITASADNKLCFVTRQKRSTLKKVKETKKRSRAVAISSYLIYFLIFGLILFALKLSLDVCQDKYAGFAELEVVRQCLVYNVLMASPDRPGVAFIPY